VLNNIWTSEHLPFFTNEPVTELEPMSPLPGAADSGEDDEAEGSSQEESGNEESGSQGENSGVATALQTLAAIEQHCYLWGPISPTYRLKSDLCFDSSSIPVRITIDQNMPEGAGTDSSYGNGVTIAIYKSDTYQRLTREDISIADGLDEGSQEQSSPQAWCEFARYEACGPICANTELYTCFAAASQNGSGEAVAEAGSYPTCWPAGYYAAAIYNVYGGCSLQSSIPKVNFYVSRKERYSSNAAGTEEDAAGTGTDDVEGKENND